MKQKRIGRIGAKTGFRLKISFLKTLDALGQALQTASCREETKESVQRRGAVFFSPFFSGSV